MIGWVVLECYGVRRVSSAREDGNRAGRTIVTRRDGFLPSFLLEIRRSGSASIHK